MNFPPLNFSVLNETDVREEIITPLLRLLGYRSGTINNVIREQSLRYPKAYIGRKNKQKDPPLRGEADYICEIDNRIRWVVEAKAPNSALDVDEIEQAFSYAFHPEIRAVYFVLCNGLSLKIFRTLDKPDSPPIFELPYDKFDSSFDQLENILGPEAIKRDFPNVQPEHGKPLGRGMRSVVRFSSGYIHYDSNSLGMIPLNEMTTIIVGGAVERDDQGKIVAFIQTMMPHRSLQELNEKLGLNEFELYSSDEFISNDPNNPTRFTGQHTLRLPAGEEILNLQSWKKIRMPINITCVTNTLALGHLENNDFKGIFRAVLDYKEMNVVVNLAGRFSVHVS